MKRRQTWQQQEQARPAALMAAFLASLVWAAVLLALIAWSFVKAVLGNG